MSNPGPAAVIWLQDSFRVRNACTAITRGNIQGMRSCIRNKPSAVSAFMLHHAEGDLRFGEIPSRFFIRVPGSEAGTGDPFQDSARTVPEKGTKECRDDIGRESAGCGMQLLHFAQTEKSG